MEPQHERHVRLTLTFILMLFVSAVQAATVSGADGVPIQYERFGAGHKTIVFVHGWTCDGSFWREQIDAFASDHRIIVMDLGGHGRSGTGRDDWSIQAFGQDVAAVVTAEAAEQVTLVGHSMGGPVVMEAALLLPGRVRQIVAVDTLQEPTRAPYTETQSLELWAPFRENFAESTEAFVRRSFFLPTAPPEIVDEVATTMASADPEMALAAGHALTTWDVPEGFAAISDIPFVLINGDYRPTDSNGLRAVHATARLVLLSGVGHFPMLVQPDDFNQELRDALLEPIEKPDKMEGENR